MSDLRGFLIRTDGRCEEHTISRENELENLYAALECRLIDIVSRTIGGTYFDIVCDDEGLLCEEPILTAATPAGEALLYGNLFVTRNDHNGSLESLTDEDVQMIKRALVRLPERHPAGLADRILLCDY